MNRKSITTKEAKKLVDKIGGEWFHGTPESLIDLVRALDNLGLLRESIEKIVTRIITDMRNEYGD